MRSRLIHWNYFNIFSFSLIWGSKLLDRYQGLLDTSVLLSKSWKTTGQTSAVDSSVKLHCRVLLATKLKHVLRTVISRNSGKFPKKLPCYCLLTDPLPTTNILRLRKDIIFDSLTTTTTTTTQKLGKGEPTATENSDVTESTNNNRDLFPMLYFILVAFCLLFLAIIVGSKIILVVR